LPFPAHSVGSISHNSLIAHFAQNLSTIFQHHEKPQFIAQRDLLFLEALAAPGALEEAGGRWNEGQIAR